MTEKLKDIAIRAMKTFWQAMVASMVVTLPEVVELIPSGWVALEPVLISALIGAIAAGLSAAWNGVLKPFVDKLKAKGGGISLESK